MFKKYYCIKQHDITDCGAACLATISKQYGFSTSITKIREVAGTDKQGTNAYGIIKAAEKLGFSAKGVKGDKNAFFSEFLLPCIGHVIVDGGLLHYVVIHKITKKQVTIADPGRGIVKLTPEEFFGETYEEGKPPKYQWSGVLILMVPDATFKKGDETQGLFQRFFHLLRPQKRLVLIDDILPAGLLRTLHILSIGIILLNIFKVILSAIRSHLLLYLSQKLDIALLLGYYNHILKLPMSFFGTRKVGEIISRFNDASKVRDAISGATLTIMIDTIMAVAGGIILYMQNSQMFAVTIVVLILYFVIVFSFNKWYRKLNEAQMEDNAQLTSYMVESLNGIQTVKAYNAERKVNLETENMVEGELLQVNGGKDILAGWIAEKILDKMFELGCEIGKIISKPKNPSGESGSDRSHSSGGRSIPAYGTPIDVDFDWRVGLFYGYVTMRYKSIIPSIILHMLFNAFPVVISTFGDQLKGQMENSIWLYIAFALVGAFIFFACFYMMRRSIALKEKV